MLTVLRFRHARPGVEAGPWTPVAREEAHAQTYARRPDRRFGDRARHLDLAVARPRRDGLPDRHDGRAQDARPARRLGHLGELCRRRRVHGPADRRRRRHADPGCCRELDDQRRRADLHLQDARPHLVGRRAGDGRGLRLLVRSASSTRKLAAEYASLLYPIKNAEAINTGKITDPSQLGVRAIDPKTLEVTLEGPTGYFLELLTHYTAWPVPKHVIEKYGAGLGQARQHRRQWRLHDHRVDARTRRSWRRRTPSSTTPPTSSSTR